MQVDLHWTTVYRDSQTGSHFTRCAVATNHALPLERMALSAVKLSNKESCAVFVFLGAFYLPSKVQAYQRVLVTDILEPRLKDGLGDSLIRL